MRALAAVSLIVFLFAVSTASGLTSTPNVRGTVVRAAGGGSCYPGEPCDPLPPAAYVVFTRGSVVTRSRLGANGSFALHLAPGRYTVRVAPPHGQLSPASITVPRVGMLRPRLVEQR